MGRWVPGRAGRDRGGAAAASGADATGVRPPLSGRFRRALSRLQPVEVVPGVHVGETPDALGVEALERAGFRSILDLDVEGVAEQPLSPNVEATWAHTFGLGHHRVSFYGPPTPDDLRRFHQTLASAERPVYVECADRALALALVRNDLRSRGPDPLEEAR